MDETLQLRLLGSPKINRGEISVAEALSTKAQAALIYLAVTGQPQHRSVLASLLWGDMPEADARTNLRRALAVLREAVGAYLELDGQTVGFRPDRPHWVDVTDFVAKATPVSESLNLERLQEAVTVYEGDFLTGFYVRNAPDFEAWMLAEQARLRELFVQALQTLADYYAGQDEPAKGMAYVRRLLHLEPWREEAHRQLMLLLARAGQRGAALAQYALCVKVLAEELGVEPGAQTQALYERIRAGELGQEVEPPPRQLEISATRLPSQPTAFIGREQELVDIKRLLLQEPACRLLTLLGPGGIGKTRLALAAAEEMTASFPQGIYFAPLASVSEPEIILSSLADVFGLQLQADLSPKSQLFNYLGEKRLLLIVDNFEHLLEGAPLLAEILAAAPQVKLLITSRERLNLQEEWSYRVEGMAFPEVISPGATAESYSAVGLFLERARRAEASFNLSEADVPHVLRLCQLVGGMPLALELAAPWVRSLSCQEIVQEIERSLDFLTTSLRNVPERHRNLSVVLEQSWQRLAEAEQAVLSKLSVFRGGSTREAALEVTGVTLTQLSLLVDKALLRRTANGRYELHELVRQFAAEKLRATPGGEEAAQDAHCAYYTAFLEARVQQIQSNEQKMALAALAADIDNIRAAWRYALARKNIEALEKSVLGLWLLGEYGGMLHENEQTFRQALSTFIPTSTPLETAVVPQAYESLVNSLLAGLGHLCARRGQLDEGRAFAEQALVRLRRSRSADPFKEALTLLSLGWVLQFQGKYAEARQRGREGLRLFTTLGDRRNIADMLLLQGIAAYGQGELAEAETLLQQAVTIFEEIEERIERGYGIQYLALIALAQGEYVRAREFLDEDLLTRQEFNDGNGMTDLLQVFSRLAIAQGHIEQAESHIQQGLTICQEAGRLVTSDFLGQLGSLRRLQGDYERAGQFFEESFELASAGHHQPDLAQSLSHLGQLAYDRGQYHQAEQHLRDALALWQQLESELGIATTLCALGHVLAARDESYETEAGHYYAQALQLAARQGLAPLALEVFTGAAELAERQENWQQALELLSLAEQHPAAAYETREKARRSLAQLRQAWPAAQEATAAGQDLNWQGTAALLIRDLSSAASQSG